MKRFEVKFLFHPASDWNNPYWVTEIFEGKDVDEAKRNFETTWYRNTSDETFREI